ncbi:MAG TPA: aminotransferase class III-fold pyridoxal phosphate-dependent enzyme, partial [Vampirovibrionales bacterium]
MSVSHPSESEVRSYCRSFPKLFSKAKGSLVFDEDGNEYVDFFAGAGTLNYGHNNDLLKKPIIEYLEADGILHGLDMSTEAKNKFIESFQKYILEPRNLDYKIQFSGPTGTNAVEAALKLAKKYTKRQGIVSFTNGFHGMTMGSLAITANENYRKNIGHIADQATFMPFENYLGDEVDTIDVFRKYLEDTSSGMDTPAAVIIETVQGEGGINVASKFWLKRLSALCKEYKILLIIDDIQIGCGRSGDFFSFEFAEIK